MILLIATKLLLAFIAIIVLLVGMFCVLRVFDKLLGIDFTEAFNKIEQDAKALAVYFGFRFLSVTLAIGFVVCVAFLL